MWPRLAGRSAEVDLVLNPYDDRLDPAQLQPVFRGEKPDFTLRQSVARETAEFLEWNQVVADWQRRIAPLG